MMVDYAPNGWSSFQDGHAVETRLTLQFKETDIVTKDKVSPSQWANDSGQINQQSSTKPSGVVVNNPPGTIPYSL